MAVEGVERGLQLDGKAQGIEFAGTHPIGAALRAVG
jgi:hypothetical protein